jgi:hypothetical protein
LQGAVEAFDFPVLPGAVRADQDVFRAERVEHGLDVVRVPVAEVVVGHDPFDAGDAVRGEVRGGAGQEPGAGGTFLVRVDLGLRQPGVVIDHRVNVVAH